MTVAKGTQTSLTVYEETQYGVPPGTPAGTKLRVVTFEVQKTRALIQPETITGDRQRSEPDADAVDVTGPIQYEIAPQDIGVLLKHLIGSVATSGTDPYIHVFTPSDLPPGIEFELDNGPRFAGANQYQTVQGGKIGAANFTFSATGYAGCSFDIIGQDVAYASTPGDAAPLDPGHRSIGMARATIEEDGVKLGVAADISLTINNNVETDVRVIQEGGLRYDAPENFVDVSGTLTALFTDATLLTKAINGTPSDLKIILKRGVGDGSAGNEYIELFVGKLIFAETSAVVSGPGSRRLELSFQGYKDGATDSITAEVRNQQPGVVKP